MTRAEAPPHETSHRRGVAGARPPDHLDRAVHRRRIDRHHLLELARRRSIPARTAIDAYVALLEGSLGSFDAIVNTLVAATPLILGGLSVGLAFKAGLFNIAQGQFLAALSARSSWG